LGGHEGSQEVVQIETEPQTHFLVGDGLYAAGLLIVNVTSRATISLEKKAIGPVGWVPPTPQARKAVRQTPRVR
jgi:hypothetical protein